MTTSLESSGIGRVMGHETSDEIGALMAYICPSKSCALSELPRRSACQHDDDGGIQPMNSLVTFTMIPICTCSLEKSSQLAHWPIYSQDIANRLMQSSAANGCSSPSSQRSTPVACKTHMRREMSYSCIDLSWVTADFWVSSQG